MPRKPKTAADIIRELEADPEYIARRAAEKRVMAERVRVWREDEADLVAGLRGLGIDVDSVWDLVNNAPHPVLERRFIGPYEVAYPLLVEHLRSAHLPRVREGIVRALTVKDGGLAVEAALLEQFDEESSQELKWVLANALHTAMPYHRRRKHPRIAAALKAGTGLGDAS